MYIYSQSNEFPFIQLNSFWKKIVDQWCIILINVQFFNQFLYKLMVDKRVRWMKWWQMDENSLHSETCFIKTTYIEDHLYRRTTCIEGPPVIETTVGWSRNHWSKAIAPGPQHTYVCKDHLSIETTVTTTYLVPWVVFIYRFHCPVLYFQDIQN